jgi:NADPH:quinone reductase-like Zn-dependent oxidoreductase
LIPVSGTGAYACQLAKNVFHAGKVITTVSTAKVPLVPQYLGEGVVDQIIDYTKTHPSKEIPRGSVDFIFDTTGEAMPFLSLVVPKTGMIISIATTPSGTQLQNSGIFNQEEKNGLPWPVLMGLNVMDMIRKARARRWGVEYSYLFMEAHWEDLERVEKFVEEKALRPVVGTRVDMRDIEKVREACMVIYKGKGGLGKTVFEVCKS